MHIYYLIVNILILKWLMSYPMLYFNVISWNIESGKPITVME